MITMVIGEMWEKNSRKSDLNNRMGSFCLETG
jgi:hypothetical protein